MTLSLYHVVGTPQLYKRAYFSGNFSEQELIAYHRRVQGESYRAYVDILKP